MWTAVVHYRNHYLLLSAKVYTSRRPQSDAEPRLDRRHSKRLFNCYAKCRPQASCYNYSIVFCLLCTKTWLLEPPSSIPNLILHYSFLSGSLFPCYLSFYATHFYFHLCDSVVFFSCLYSPFCKFYLKPFVPKCYVFCWSSNCVFLVCVCVSRSTDPYSHKSESNLELFVGSFTSYT